MAGSSLAFDRNSPHAAFKSCSRASVLHELSANPELMGLISLMEAGDIRRCLPMISRMAAGESLRHSCSGEMRINSQLSTFLGLFFLLLLVLLFVVGRLARLRALTVVIFDVVISKHVNTSDFLCPLRATITQEFCCALLALEGSSFMIF